MESAPNGNDALWHTLVYEWSTCAVRCDNPHGTAVRSTPSAMSTALPELSRRDVWLAIRAA